MLSSLVKEHNQKVSSLKEEQEKKRKEALNSSNAICQALVDHLNIGYVYVIFI